jgi:hypothetical protein
MSQLFVGAGNSLQEVQAVQLDEESLRDIATRIKLQPNFMGEPLVVIGEAADFPQIRSGSDYTLVGVDTGGNLVVIELRQGIARSEENLNALRYAAYIATLSPEDLGKIARAFISRPANMAIARMWKDAHIEMNEETVELSSLLATAFGRDAEDFADNINRSQRIILASEGFDARMVEVVDWLGRWGADVRGVQYSKFMIGGQEIYQAQQVVPDEDPAIDRQHRRGPAASDVEEPWRVRGLSYYLERLTPAMGNKLQEFLQLTKPFTFATDWSQKYFFLLRGSRRNLRVRVYQRNRLDIGFLDTSVERVSDFLKSYRLENHEPVLFGGYEKSPFVGLTSDTELDDRWVCLLGDWLSGQEPGASNPALGEEPV